MWTKSGTFKKILATSSASFLLKENETLTLLTNTIQKSHDRTNTGLIHMNVVWLWFKVFSLPSFKWEKWSVNGLETGLHTSPPCMFFMLNPSLPFLPFLFFFFLQQHFLMMQKQQVRMRRDATTAMAMRAQGGTAKHCGEKRLMYFSFDKANRSTLVLSICVCTII